MILKSQKQITKSLYIFLNVEYFWKLIRLGQ